MNDRELLELAAKAAGIEFDFCRPELGGCQVRKGLVSGWWNPLASDGDALRLAVELGLSVSTGIDWAEAKIDGLTSIKEFSNEDYQDIFAATRTAIVRAAAKIGRHMQEGGAT